MAPAIRHDLSESSRAREHRLYRRRKGMDSTRRTPVLETAAASRGRAGEVRSWPGNAQVTFEIAADRPIQCSRFDRDFRGSRQKPPEQCRTWEFHATLFAMSAPGPDTENRISLRK